MHANIYQPKRTNLEEKNLDIAHKKKAEILTFKLLICKFLFLGCAR